MGFGETLERIFYICLESTVTLEFLPAEKTDFGKLPIFVNHFSLIIRDPVRLVFYKKMPKYLVTLLI